MTIYKEFNIGGNNRSPFGSFGPLLGLILFMIIGYFLVTGLFKLLTLLTPFLLIGAALLDYTVLTDFLKFMLKLLKENPLMALVAVLLIILGGYPAVAGYLFFKAWARRTINKKLGEIKNERDRFDEYEEVKTDTKSGKEDEDFLILPNVEKAKPQEKKSDYEDLF